MRCLVARLGDESKPTSPMPGGGTPRDKTSTPFNASPPCSCHRTGKSATFCSARCPLSFSTTSYPNSCQSYIPKHTHARLAAAKQNGVAVSVRCPPATQNFPVRCRGEEQATRFRTDAEFLRCRSGDFATNHCDVKEKGRGTFGDLRYDEKSGTTTTVGNFSRTLPSIPWAQIQSGKFILGRVLFPMLRTVLVAFQFELDFWKSVVFTKVISMICDVVILPTEELGDDNSKTGWLVRLV